MLDRAPDKRPTASSRNRVLFQFGGTAHDGEELRLLLHKRLRLLCGCALLLMVAYLIRISVEDSLGKKVALLQYLVACLSLLIYGPLVLLLRLRASIPLAKLRYIELFLFLWGSAGVYAISALFLWRGGVSPLPLPDAVQPLLRTWTWVAYGDGSLQVDSAYRVFSAPVIINFSLLIFTYGVFIPNTWRRCFIVLACMVALAEVCINHALWRVPVLRKPGNRLTPEVRNRVTGGGAGVETTAWRSAASAASR